MNREQAMKKYNLMKSDRDLDGYLDYDPSFLRRLSDQELIYLVTFLINFYEGAGSRERARKSDMHAHSTEVVSTNEIDDRCHDFEETAHIIRFVRPCP